MRLDEKSNNGAVVSHFLPAPPMEAEPPDPESKRPFTVVATPKGLVLSTPNGQFLIQSTVGDPRREIDPAALFGLCNSDPGALALQALNLS